MGKQSQKEQPKKENSNRSIGSSQDRDRERWVTDDRVTFPQEAKLETHLECRTNQECVLVERGARQTRLCENRWRQKYGSVRRRLSDKRTETSATVLRTCGCNGHQWDTFFTRYPNADLPHQRLCLSSTTLGGWSALQMRDVYDDRFADHTGAHLCSPRGGILDALKWTASTMLLSQAICDGVRCFGLSSSSVFSKRFRLLQPGSIQCKPPLSCPCLLYLWRVS